MIDKRNKREYLIGEVINKRDTFSNEVNTIRKHKSKLTNLLK